MKHSEYVEWVQKSPQAAGGLSNWPERHVWLSPSAGQWVHIGFFNPGGNFTSDERLPTASTGVYGGGTVVGGIYGTYRANGVSYKIWPTTSEELDPHNFRVSYGYTTDWRQRIQQPQPQPQPQAPAYGAPSQGRQPARQVRPVAVVQQNAWVARGGHAFRGNADLGLLVNDHQVVRPTNGGRLWALYNLSPAGQVEFVGSYGEVAGAPPPPNAHKNEARPAGRDRVPPGQGRPAYRPPPPPPPPPPPQPQVEYVYAEPQVQYVYAEPAPQVQYVYAPPPAPPPPVGYGYPTYGAPTYAPPAVYEPSVSVSYGYPAQYPPQYPPQYPAQYPPQYPPQYGYPQEPQMSAADAAYYGAQMGTQQAIAALAAQEELEAQQQAQMDFYAAMMGGGGYGGAPQTAADMYVTSYDGGFDGGFNLNYM